MNSILDEFEYNDQAIDINSKYKISQLTNNGFNKYVSISSPIHTYKQTINPKSLETIDNFYTNYSKTYLNTVENKIPKKCFLESKFNTLVVPTEVTIETTSKLLKNNNINKKALVKHPKNPIKLCKGKIKFSGNFRSTNLPKINDTNQNNNSLTHTKLYFNRMYSTIRTSNYNLNEKSMDNSNIEKLCNYEKSKIIRYKNLINAHEIPTFAAKPPRFNLTKPNGSKFMGINYNPFNYQIYTK